MAVLPGLNGEDYKRYTMRGCAACVRVVIGSLRKDTSRREASTATQSDDDGGVR